MDLERLKARAAEIADRESKILLDRTSDSKALYERALKSLPSGVSSNFQAGEPYPVYLQKAKGSTVWDVDGSDYTDFHGGFGVNVVGHAHPKIVEAIRKVADQGIHFAVTTESTEKTSMYFWRRASGTIWYSCWVWRSRMGSAVCSNRLTMGVQLRRKARG